MKMNDRLRDLIEPIVENLDLELFDLDFSGSSLVVTIERPPASDGDAIGPRPGGSGVGIADIAKVTRALSNALDEADPIPGAYALEVSSPGLERTLRTPRHFQWAVGQTVSIKTVPGFESGRRCKGTLLRADETAAGSIDVEGDDAGAPPLTIGYDQIEKARTVFEWGGEPKPGSPTPRTKAGAAKNTAKNNAKATPASKAKANGKNKAKTNPKSGPKSGPKADAKAKATSPGKPTPRAATGGSHDSNAASSKQATAQKTAEQKKVTA